MTPFISRLERAFPWLLLSPVLLPLVIWGGLIYPYLVPKTLLFYTLSLIAIATFLVLVAHGRTFYWSRLVRPETWVPGGLLLVAYISSLFGIDFYRSFWSLFIRGDGLLMYTCAIASFYLILLSADHDFFRRLTRGAAIVSSFVALYGIGEWLIGGGRIGSLLGNAAFFAGYLGIGLFVTLMTARELSNGWRTAAYAAASAEVLAIILSATRGTILALGITLIALLAWNAYQGDGKTRRTSLWLLGGLLLFAGVFFAFRSELSRVPFEPIARVASIGTSDSDIASRLFIWKNMMGEIGKNPWLGVGAEHVDVLFNRFYDPSLIAEQWFDRSHNALLDYFAQFGIAGFALYVLLIGTFFVAAKRLGRRGEGRLALLVVLLALAYAVQNFFVFDTISSFWLLLALLAALIAASTDAEPELLPLPSWTRPASWAMAIVLVGFLVPVSVRPTLAAYDLAHGYAYGLVDVAKETDYLEKGYALGTYGDVEYGYTAYDAYSNTQMGRLSGDALKQAYKVTTSLLRQNFDRYPYDARTALYLAQMLSTAPQGEATDPNLLSAALARTMQESPKRAQPWYILANLSISQANENAPGSAARAAGYKAAIDILNRYIALVPALSEPHYVLAQLLYATGQTAAASLEAAKGKQYYHDDLETAKRAVGYYEMVLDLPNAEFFLQEILRMEPGTAAAAQDLEKIKSYGKK
ncbi:MAG TPA: O-antigen ligase family protein [Candidatus Paceibacterota bacterium]|nr:O-antigen ligase family protein [Candidatus Paceibacterota bacterium]